MRTIMAQGSFSGTGTWIIDSYGCRSSDEELPCSRKAISPVWSYEQSVTQKWIPVDLSDTLCVALSYSVDFY